MSNVRSTPDLYRQDRIVTIRTVPETRLAYVRSRGPYYTLSNEGGAALDRLKSWAEIRGLWDEETPIVGVCPDNPAVTPPYLCHYDYGIAVENGVQEDATVCIQVLPKRRLAALEVHGSLMVQKEAWTWFLSEWLPQSGMVFSGHAFYEMFKLVSDGPEATKTTLYVPVKPQS